MSQTLQFLQTVYCSQNVCFSQQLLDPNVDKQARSNFTNKIWRGQNIFYSNTAGTNILQVRASTGHKCLTWQQTILGVTKMCQLSMQYIFILLIPILNSKVWMFKSILIRIIFLIMLYVSFYYFIIIFSSFFEEFVSLFGSTK